MADAARAALVDHIDTAAAPAERLAALRAKFAAGDADLVVLAAAEAAHSVLSYAELAIAEAEAECTAEAEGHARVCAAAPAPSPFRWDAAAEAARLTLLPVWHDDIWAFRKRLESLHWTAQEVTLAGDAADWARASPEERNFLRLQLGFFASADVWVLQNLGENFAQEIGCLEARAVYAAQADQEVTHSEAYALQIEAVLPGAAEQAEVLEAVRTMPVVGRMRDWVARWSGRDRPLGERLAAFAAVEGVLFSASFAALQWLRERAVYPGITAYNTFIARDENVHTEFACLLVRRHLTEAARPAAARVAEIFGEAVAVLDEFVAEALPVALIGMNAALMAQYVRYQADHVMGAMGYPAVFGAPNPFPFMDKLAMNDVCKTNFFEHRSSQYQAPVSRNASALALAPAGGDSDDE